MPPPPHASSTTPSRGSRTTTDIPAATAWSAVASPAGPPPATTRSIATSAPRCGVRERPVLRPDPHGEQRSGGGGEDGGGEPGGVDQRQGEALDDDGHVVGEIGRAHV